MTPVAGSIFRPLSQTQNLRSEFRFPISPDFKFCFTWHPTDIILCWWSGFISPRIRTFVEKCFHGLFSEKKGSKSGGVPSFLWVEAEVNFFRREKLCRRDYLNYLKNRAKPTNMENLNSLLKFWVWESGRKIDPATGVTLCNPPSP